MKRTNLQKYKNTDEQFRFLSGTCEFHPVEISFNEQLIEPKYNQMVKSFIRMKSINNRNSFWLLMTFAILLVTNSAMAQYSESKDVRKGFKSTLTSTVEIDNKYGDINIETWSKDSVVVEIHVEVSDKTMGKVHDRLRSLNFDLSQMGNYIVLNTIIGDNGNLLLSEFNKLKEQIGVGSSQVQIDMTIKMPDKLPLRIKNKFGNIYMGDYNGEINFDLSNGKLKAQNLTGYSTIKISFGDARINSIDSGNLEVYYGELNLNSARKLRMKSKKSNINITQVGQLSVNSSIDEYRIRMIDEFETEANFTDFSISEFKLKSEIKMNFGELTIDNILPSMKNLFIDARSTKINLYLAPETKINFDITSNKDVNLPMNTIIDSKNKTDDDKTFRYIGRTSDINKADPKLILKLKSGDITLISR